MKDRTKSFAVLGLGRFGSNIARTLEEYGAQVLAVDSREEKVEEIADEVTHAVQADVTDLSALRSMGIADFDGVIVAIGENTGDQYHYDYASEGSGRKAYHCQGAE